jgi:hypothetical protein
MVKQEKRRTYMQQKQNAKKNVGSIMKPEFAGTDAQEVKQEIQNDVSAGQGAMTSREAGSMRD